MSLNKSYRCNSGKLCGGPGGWKCNCCNPYGGSNKGKAKARRIVRRKSKLEINKEKENEC